MEMAYGTEKKCVCVQIDNICCVTVFSLVLKNQISENERRWEVVQFDFHPSFRGSGFRASDISLSCWLLEDRPGNNKQQTNLAKT